jgi:hypothetical protein
MDFIRDFITYLHYGSKLPDDFRVSDGVRKLFVGVMILGLILFVGGFFGFIITQLKLFAWVIFGGIGILAIGCGLGDAIERSK